ncbi:transcriptional regulator of RNA polII, SAGA, subunit-domain-containing protein [Naematelia encephala]|uniref:Transcriptional regulator of RNA polII, SAGA, subunit-domain-containing protein n=1 Tax=Naematelia encephala TaxID=71784 RepID=A0A1Y2BA74_9TREE|nr:transcriptional regulator of RNA polII, SAGA, subunit-domain-containing protein [Naematelia encephala]
MSPQAGPFQSLPSIVTQTSSNQFVALQDGPTSPSQSQVAPIPFERMDVHLIKQELHDVLGRDGLPYWKALNGYLLGQVSRDELNYMVQTWLKGENVSLHDRLLVSVLYNAGSPISSSHVPQSPLSARKRKRALPEDPDFDIDESYIEPKARVQHWMSGITGKERSRLRRAIIERQAGEEDAEGEEEEEDWAAGGGGAKAKKWSPGQAITMPPLAAPSRLLPSASQLGARLSQIAKSGDLNLSANAVAEIGEFLALGLDSRLSDVLYSLVHMIGKDRPGADTIHVRKGAQGRQGIDVDGDEPYIKAEPDTDDLPKPDLETFQHLFELSPKLHPQASTALYKLATGLTAAEAEIAQPVKHELKPDLPSEPSSPNTADTTMQRLLDYGLLKLDKAGRQTEEGEAGKKEKKHNLHWKYEDPALILKDFLG